METVRFVVEGSRGDHYEVAISREASNINATCSCAAGAHGIHCKHRLALLRGEVELLVAGNEEDLAAVAQWLDGSDVGAALLELDAAEGAYAAAKQALADAKKRLSRALAR